MLSNSSFENLLGALEKLSSDKRLARVIQGNNPCSLHLWLLEIIQANTTEYRLLFGWVIPSTSQNTNIIWSISDGGKKKTLGNQEEFYKFRIAKLTLYHNSSAIFNLIKRLCEGKTLEESCNLAGIVHPKQPYSQLRLVEAPKQVDKFFTIRPAVFLETIETNRARFKELQPINSPIYNVSGFAGFLWRIDKLSLFSKNGEEPLLQADELAKECLLHMTAETGLDFCSTSSKRIGNIEWLCFPAADETENLLVKVKTKPSTNDVYEVEVEILADALTKDTKFLIGCELRNDYEIILNECKNVQIKDKTIIASFQVQQPIINILITIWIQNKDDEQWEIWYRHSPFVLQGINVNLQSVFLQANLPSDWLKEFINSKVRSRVEKAQNIRQVGSQRLKIGGYKPAPWIPASTEMIRLTQRLFPEPSGGGFFLKGWDGDEPGRLRFFEWLQSLTKNITASKILIIDPYFGASGITEVIARAEATDTEYVVLTNTQIKSDDDLPELESAKDKLEEPQRATLLKQVCEQVELLLNSLKFRLLDLRSKKGGKIQIFHDRYILVFDKSGYVQTGYHLSNSLQGATRKHSLLITPIPEPELTEVEEYVSELLEPTNDSTTEVITLFSSVKEIKNICCTERKQGVAAIPYAGLFFAALLNETLLLCVDESEIYKYIQQYGIIFCEDSNITIPEEIHSKLDYFVQILVSSSAEIFAKLWIAFGAWLAQIPDSDEHLDQTILTGGENLAIKIQNFLCDASEKETPIGLLGTSSNLDSARISNLILKNFKEGLRCAERLLIDADSRSWYCFPDDWGIQYAAKTLVQLYPDKLVSVISQIAHLLPANENNHKYWGLANNLTSILKQLLDQVVLIKIKGVTDKGLLTALLISNVPLLRAIASQSLSPLSNQKTDLENSFATIDILPEEIERVYVLAEWVFEIRVRANRKNYQEDTGLQTIRLAIFDKIRQIFPNNLKQEEIQYIVNLLSGPGDGNWAISTTNELLLPLVQEKKLTIDEIAQLWLEILYEKLKAHITATDNNENGESSYPLFYAITDEELTKVCGCVLAKANIECRKSWLDKFKKEIQKPCERVLYRPFSHSRDFSAWCGNYNALLWLQTLFNLTQLFGTHEKISNSEKDELKELVIKIDEVLNTNLKDKENLLENTKILLEFSHKVKQQLEAFW